VSQEAETESLSRIVRLKKTGGGGLDGGSDWPPRIIAAARRTETSRDCTRCTHRYTRIDVRIVRQIAGDTISLKDQDQERAVLHYVAGYGYPLIYRVFS